MSFFSELKRRNVFKVGAGYLILTWVVIQVADTAVPALRLPEWVNTLVFFIGIIGLPFALFLAWAFELTPDGIKRDADIEPSDASTIKSTQTINGFIAVGLILALGFIIYQQFYSRSDDLNQTAKVIQESTGEQKTISSRPKVKEKNRNQPISIAVLPFVNMSSDTSQEYFSDGMTEEILNVLAKNNRLLVAARTSAFFYKGKNIDIRTIGDELGVDHVLEGSVRRAGDDLRITAQLIRVEDGFHLWSETYDRKLEKIFILQEEIAKDISKALAVPLGIKSGELIVNKTSDIGAYDLFLKGRMLMRKRGKSIEQAANLMAEVIQKDPQYAPARAIYSLALNYVPGYLSSYQNKPLNLEKIRAESLKNARIAVQLDPTLAIAHYALANNYREHLSWELAEDEYLKALQFAPNNIDIIEDYAQLLQVVGRLKESTALAKRGYELEPQTPLAILNYADKLYYNFSKPDFNKIKKLTLQVLSIEPGSIWAKIQLEAMYTSQKQYQKAINSYADCQECKLAPDIQARLYYLEQLLSKTQAIETKIPLAKTLDLNFAFDVGGNDLVLDTLEQMNRFDSSLFIQTPFMQEIRKTKRFKTVAKYFGLVDYWRLRHWPDFCHPVSDTDFECD